MNNAVRSQQFENALGKAWDNVIAQRGNAFGIMILGALLAFEVFNFGTTEFALHDVLGNLTFAGIKWSTILAIAFCGIDFAGIARIFTPEQGAEEPMEVWYLFVAWFLAAGMNAMLTWWGVSVATVTHVSQGSAVVGNDVIHNVVPVFVALMVWVIRTLIIWTFSVWGDKLFSQPESRPVRRNYQQGQYNNAPAKQPAPAQQSQRPAQLQRAPTYQTHTVYSNSQQRSNYKAQYRPGQQQQQQYTDQRPVITTAAQLLKAAPKPTPAEPIYSRPEPTYHNLMSSAETPQDG